MIDYPGALNPAREGVGGPAARGSGYLARPPRGSGPGVLLLHPWWGLNETVKGFADRLAGEGFVALAPDMFRGQVATTIAEAEELAPSMEENEGVRIEQAVLGALDWLAADTGAPCGALGLSFGAGYALWLARKRPDQVGAVVLFYGTGGPASEGTAQIMGHFAADDPYEPAEGVDELEAQLRQSGRLEAVHRYPGTSHWFAEPDRPEYDPQAAGLAWQRTLEFLREKLAA